MTFVHTYLDTTIQTTDNGVDTFTLGGGDQLIVADTGAIVALGVSSNALMVHASSSTVLYMDGHLYSATGIGLVSAADGGGLRAYINGSITGLGGIAALGSGDQIFIGAQGNVFGFNAAVDLGGVNVLFSNAGHVFGAGAAGDDDGIAFEISGANAQIVNTGTVEAVVYAMSLSSGATNATVTNTGTIIGGVATPFGTPPQHFNIVNGGTWIASNGLTLTSASDSIDNTGNIRASVFMGSGDDTFTNTGNVHGLVDMSSGINFVNNSGTMNAIAFAGTGDVLINAGLIHGGVQMGTDARVTNTGTIDGNLAFTGGTNTFDTSHGTMTGSVTGGSGSDAFTGGVADDLFNGGAGTDTLKGGGGDDALNGDNGKDLLIGGRGDDQLGGGGSSDTFAFAGKFGDDLITDFAATGANHDVIHFAHSDFSGYAAVQSHMVQAGTDVVITTDAGDTIVIVGLTVASLVAADFTFG